MTELFKERCTFELELHVPAANDIQSEWHAGRLMARLADVARGGGGSGGGGRGRRG